MANQLGNRQENVPIVAEIFTAAGSLAEAFVFTGPVAYHPNGIVEVAYRNAKNNWVDFPPTKYAIQAGGVGVAFIPGFSVAAGTLIRVIYLSPDAFGKKRLSEEGPLRLLNMSLTHISDVAANVAVVPSNTYQIQSPYSTDIGKAKRISLIITGQVKNTFAGGNNIDGAQNIQMNINGGGWTTIFSIPNLSLPCDQGGTHGIGIVEDITTLVTAFTDRIGVRWASAKTANDGFDLTATALVKILWEI